MLFTWLPNHRGMYNIVLVCFLNENLQYKNKQDLNIELRQAFGLHKT